MIIKSKGAHASLVLQRSAQEVLSRDPRRVGNRGPNRWSWGSCSRTGHMLHEPDWAMLIDLPTVTPILNVRA